MCKPTFLLETCSLKKIKNADTHLHCTQSIPALLHSGKNKAGQCLIVHFQLSVPKSPMFILMCLTMNATSVSKANHYSAICEYQKTQNFYNKATIHFK